MNRIALLVVLIVAANVHAQPCHPAARSCAVQQAAIVQQVLAVPAVTFQSILVPVYAAAYVGPQVEQQTAADDETKELLRQLLEETRAMRADLQSLRGPVLPLVQEGSLKAIQTNCQKCHSPTTADAAGGGFKLFAANGSLAQLDARDKARVVNRVSRNSMPPAPAKVTAADKKAILEAFQTK